MMELEVTWQRLLRIWWAWCWRSVLATIAGAVMAFLAGLWIGALSGALGLPPWLASVVSTALGFVLALALSVIPLWQILGRDFGEFRLVLMTRR